MVSVKRDELRMLLVILWDFAEALFVVLIKLDTTQLAAGTGAKEAIYLDT